MRILRRHPNDEERISLLERLFIFEAPRISPIWWRASRNILFWMFFYVKNWIFSSKWHSNVSWRFSIDLGEKLNNLPGSLIYDVFFFSLFLKVYFWMLQVGDKGVNHPGKYRHPSRLPNLRCNSIFICVPNDDQTFFDYWFVICCLFWVGTYIVGYFFCFVAKTVQYVYSTVQHANRQYMYVKIVYTTVNCNFR